MSTTIDSRVVEMQFDNRHFERNVQTSLSTLDKLKQSLNLTGASKGLEDISSAANKVNFSGMMTGIEQVGVKFSYLQATIQHQLNNIVDSAVSAGKRMASALTIDPVKTGFSEYETQINAVQTILANTSHAGTDINDVNKALDELNLYADKTIYNFTEMTRNIGTFTAAGLGLEESTAAIKGIANLAAVSGSTSTQASTAMYQLSQALANGKVNLQDWNSVVNAGMGGKVFQDALVRTAAAMQGVTEETFRANNITGSFRESISSRDGGGWLTAEVLSNTLQQFTGDLTEAELAAQGFTAEQIKSIQAMGVTANEAATKVKTYTQLWDTLKESAQSGWSQTWKTLVGDFEEAKEMWTGVSDTIGKIINDSSERRNTMLSGALDTNWEKMIKKINEAGIESTTFEEKLRSTMESHKIDVDKLIEEHGSLTEVFRSGAVSSDILKEAVDSLSTSLVDLSKIDRKLEKGHRGEDVKLAQEALKNLGHDIGKTGADGIFGKKTEEAVKAFQELKGLKVTGIIDDATLKALEEANEKTAGLAESCKGFISAITDLGGREILIEAVKNAFEGLKSVLKPIGEAFREVFPPTTSEQLFSLIEKFRDFTKNLKLNEEQSKLLKSTFKGLFSVVDIGITFIKDIAGGALKLLGSISGLGNGLLGITGSMGDWLSSLRDSVKETDIFGTVIDKIVGFLTSAIDKIKEFGSSIKESFSNPDHEGFLGFFKGLWEFVKNLGSEVSKIFSAFGDGLANAFGEDTNFMNVLNGGLFAGILAGVMKLIKGLSNPLDAIGDVFDAFTDKDGILDNITGVLDDVRGCFTAYQNQLKAGTLLKIAGAIAILAASIWVIASIDETKLNSSLGAITILFGELLGSLAIFSKLSGSMKGVVKSSIAMIGMSVAVLILSAALKVLVSAVDDFTKLDSDNLVKGLLAMGVALGEIAVAMKIMPKGIISKSIGIVILAAALKVLASAVDDFIKLDSENLVKGLLAMGVALGEVALAMQIMPKGTIFKSTGIVILAAALKVLASAVDDFIKLDSDNLVKGLLAMGVALGEVAVAMKIMPKGIISKSIGVVILAGALKVLASAVDDFTKLDSDNLVKGLLAMGVALAEVVVAMQLMRGTTGSAISLVLVAGALTIFASVLKVLGDMPVADIVKGLVTLAVGLGIIVAAGYLLTPVIPALLGLSAAFALFGVATLGIGAGLVLIGVGLSAIAAGFTAFAVAGVSGATAFVAALSVIITGILSLIPTIVETFGEIILAVCSVIIECAPQIAETILVVITEVLKALATYTPQIVEALMQFVIGVLNAFANNLPDLIVAAVNVIMAFFQGIVDALSGIDTSTLLKGIVGIGILAGIMAALSAVAGLVPGAMIGVLGMGLVIAELALVLAAIGGLAQIPGLKWLIDEGGELLQSIGTAIGKFIGGLVGGFAAGATASLPEVGTNLSMFMMNLTPFIMGVKMIDDQVMAGVGILSAAILALTAADLIAGVASFLSGGTMSFAQLGTDLSMFMTNAMPFIMSASLLNASMMDGVKALAQTILILTAADVLNGLTSWITGGSSLSTFGAQLPQLGSDLADFASNLGTFDDNTVKTVSCAANAIKALATAASSLPNEGGWLGAIVGENGIGTFAAYLPEVGTHLADFASNLGEFTDAQVTTVTCAANAIKAIANAAQDIPNEGGWAAKIFGDNSIAAFGGKLPQLGTDLADFASNLGTFDDTKVATVTCAANAITAIAKASNGIDGQSEWGKKIFGENGIAAFSGKMPGLGENLAKFAENLGTFDETKIATINAAVRAIKVIAELGKIDWGDAKKTISGFGDKMVTLAEKIADFSSKMTDVDSSVLSTAISNVKKLVTMLTDLKVVSDDTAKNFKSALKTLGNSGVDSFVKEFTSEASKTNVKKSAAKLMDKAVEGMKSKSADVKKAGTSVASEAASGIKSDTNYSKFYNAGKYLVEGFAAGISENTFQAEAKAKAMANAAEEAARKALDINSPSKVFRKIGAGIPEGFAQGITKLRSEVVKSSTGMADTAIDNVKSSIGRIAEAINTYIDSQPTIRPVLDLSDVESGAGLIGGLFGSKASVGVMANIDTISSMMNNRVQNGGNGDIVSAIDKLRKDLGNTSGNVYNLNGITYDDGSAIQEAIGTIVRHARIERRV